MNVKALLFTALGVVVGMIAYNMFAKKLLKIDSFEY